MKHRPCPPLKWANAVGTSAKYEKYTKKSHKYIVTVDDCRMDTAQRPTQGLRRSCRRCRPWDLQDESTSATKKTKMSDTWKKNIKTQRFHWKRTGKDYMPKIRDCQGPPKNLPNLYRLVMAASFVVHKDSTTASLLEAASLASRTAFATLAATNRPLKKPWPWLKWLEPVENNGMDKTWIKHG